MGPPLINARVETVRRKRAFAEAFRERRCLVPADGWFEWEPGPARQPFHLTVAGGSPFSFAAVWGALGDGIGSDRVVCYPHDAGCPFAR